MARGPRYNLAFRRRREERTQFRRRRAMVTSGKTRFIVRLTRRYVIAQFASSEPIGDKILVSAHSRDLGRYGWKASRSNTAAAYLTGLLAGRRAKDAGISDAILDMGLRTNSKGSRIYATLKGALDAGISIPHDSGILPAEGRIRGEHVADYAGKLAASSEMYRRQFSSYLKAKNAPEDLPKMFNSTLKAISAK